MARFTQFLAQIFPLLSTLDNGQNTKKSKCPHLSHFKAYLEAGIPAGLPAVGMGLWDQQGGYHEGDDEG